MRHVMIAASLAVGISAVAATAQAADPGVQVEHAAARLVVIPEARSDVSVSIHQGDPRLPPLVARQQGGTVVVDGGLDRRSIACKGGVTLTRTFGFGAEIVDHSRVEVQGVGVVDFKDLPMVTAHVPLASVVGASGAVWGQVGAAQRLSVTNAGCGDWSLGDVGGPLSVELVGSGDLTGARAGVLRAHIAGSGDIKLGDVGGDADLGLAGSGDVRTGAVGGALHAKLAGSGNVRLASINGPVQVLIAASGDVVIDGGRAPEVSVKVVGSGDFTFHGQAGSVSAAVVGSGDVQVAHASGPVSRSVVGSGEITVGR